MPRICLVDKSVLTNRYNTIQHFDFVCTVAALAQATSELHLEVFLEFIFVPRKLRVSRKGCEIVAVHSHGNVTISVVEYTGI